MEGYWGDGGARGWSRAQHEHDNQREQLGPAGGLLLCPTVLQAPPASAERADRRLVEAIATVGCKRVELGLG